MVVRMYFERSLSGQRLKQLREEKELTQGQLAYLIGVRQQAIAKYEKTEVKNLWIINKLATAFKLEVSDLWK